MADDNRHLRATRELVDRPLTHLTQGDIVSVRMDEVEDAFVEWDENAAIAQGSQSSALPAMSRTRTLSDPVTTRRLAKASQRIAIPERVPETLEEALLALAERLGE
jgi:hypothetical protein